MSLSERRTKASGELTRMSSRCQAQAMYVETYIVLVPWKLSAKPPVFFGGALHPNGASPKLLTCFGT